MYDAGLIEQIPDKLASCLKSGFSKEEKSQAYKLIILSYLFDDNMEMADEYMNLFLHDFPAYEPVATDPYEFIQLKETYNTEPIFKIGPVIGGNFALVSVMEQYGSHDVTQVSGSYTTGNPGFETGIQASYQLAQGLNLFGELYFYHISVDYQLENNDLSEIDEFYEQKNRIDIPLGISIDFSGEKVVPYMNLGIKPGFSMGANADINNSFLQNGIQVAKTRETNYFNLGGLDNFFSLWTFIGGGVRYKVPKGYFFAELRFNYNLLNQANSKNRFENQDLVWYYNYQRDDFRLHDFAFSAGYLISFYNPRKKSSKP